MTIEEFILSVEGKNAPAGINDFLLALWYDKKGEWDKSHEISQNLNNASGYWIHAYLHRKEGDLGNAAYWYQRAGKELPQSSISEEWRNLLVYFIDPENK
jgi:hypothetical protein